MRLPRGQPRRPDDRLGRALRRGLQAPRAVPRPGGSGARDGHADPRREGGPERAGAGAPRSPTPARSPATRAPRRRPSTPRASSSATTSTTCSRRAALVSRSRRLGRRVGRGRTGVVTVSTGEGSLIADLAPRARAGPAADPGRTRARESPPPCRRWATSATRSTRGAPARAAPTYRACFDALRRLGRLRRPRARP